MAVRDANLVPERVLMRRYTARHTMLWGCAYGLLIALLLGSYFVFTVRTLASRRLPTSESDVLKKLAETIATIEQRKGELGRLEFVREVSGPVGAAEILGRLSSNIDRNTWLTRLSLSLPPSGTAALELDGLAMSNADLGKTMTGLASSSAFTDVGLRSSAELMGAGLGPGIPEELVQFRIRVEALTE